MEDKNLMMLSIDAPILNGTLSHKVVTRIFLRVSEPRHERIKIGSQATWFSYFDYC